MGVIPVATVAPVDVEPIPRPVPVDRDEYEASTCPLCYRPLSQRVHGLFCFPCRGWLVETLANGRLVYSLWQGRP